jgi:hypothetical protein
MRPKVGDIWQYADGFRNYHYLVAKILDDTGSEDHLFESTLICLSDGTNKNRYVWPRRNPRWRFIA